MRSSPTIAQLRAFVAIAELQHFRDAAASLAVSQPTLSQALSTLESNLGVRLIERNPRHVLVTPDGERLLPLARQILDSVDAFRKAARPAAWLSGPMHLGVIPTIAPYLLPALLAALAEEAPSLQVYVHEDQTARLLDGLATGAVDVAILALPIEDPRVRAEPLYEEDFVLAVPPGHPWEGARDVRPSRIDEGELLLLDQGHCLRDQVMQVCLSAGLAHPGESTARAASVGTIVQLVAAGLGVTFLPEGAVHVEAGRSRLGVARFAGPVPGRTVALARRRSSTRVDEFEALADIVRRAACAGMPAVRPVVQR